MVVLIPIHLFIPLGVVDVFVVLGPTPRDVTRQFTALVGRQVPPYFPFLSPLSSQAMPPLFAIGYHQCRWNYNNQRDVLDVNDKFNELDIPYSVIWLDIEHTDGKVHHLLFLLSPSLPLLSFHEIEISDVGLQPLPHSQRHDRPSRQGRSKNGDHSRPTHQSARRLPCLRRRYRAERRC